MERPASLLIQETRNNIINQINNSKQHKERKKFKFNPKDLKYYEEKINILWIY